MKILPAKATHEARIREIYLAAFGPSEARTVAGLAVTLLSHATTPRSIHLVALEDGVPAGHVAFTPVWRARDHRTAGYILAPLAVAPTSQRRGIGAALVGAGLEEIQTRGDAAVFVYGDPDYYGRFGFRHALAEAYRPPQPLQYPAGWQALLLGAGTPPASPVDLTCVEPLHAPELW